MIIEKIFGTIIGGVIGGMICFFATFAVTKKLFKKRTLSYLISGITPLIACFVNLFEESFSKIILILCMILDIICTLVFYIGEKRALKSGKHCGDFEKDRGARKFTPYSFKKLLKKYPYPFLKEKGILNNLEYRPANIFVDENSYEYKQEVMSRKLTGHLFHWLFIYVWYAILFGIWTWYFIGYGVYWMFVATIDTFKELYTQEGSNFSFQSAISEIANSDELATGINTIKKSVKSATSKTESTISEIGKKTSSKISEHKSKPSNDTNKTKKPVKSTISKAKTNKTVLLDKQTDNINTINFYDNHLPDNDEELTTDYASSTISKNSPINQTYKSDDLPYTSNTASPPTPKKNYSILIIMATIIIILVLAVGILVGILFSMKSNDNNNIDTPDSVFSFANLAKSSDKEESQIYGNTPNAELSGDIQEENNSALGVGKKENSSSAFANAYIELRSGINKDTSSGMITWYRRPGTNYYLHVNGDYSYYKYEYYDTAPDGEISTLIKSDITSESVVYIDSGSGGLPFIVYVTPYNADGVAGKKVMCTSDENTEKTFEPFTIEVINSYLSYHSGPGHEYEINGDITDHGTYTIVDESGGWGKLESGKGWINLNDASYESPLSHKTAAMMYEEEQKSNFEPYIIKIENSYLPYYSGAGYNYTVNGSITDKGKYTIVEESGDWGKLKSGAGWINLNDAKNASSSGGQSNTFEPYIIKIENSYLPYYSGPGYDYSVNGAITDKSKYTIVEESGDWGKLKSGAGWINLIDAKNASSSGGQDTYSNSVTVYSCNYYGQISTSGGTTNGYSTSYIVDGGVMSCVRTDLMNNWHVTAVNYCISNGTTWYELYDTDDGDYYGWVDASHVNF